jgi:hypothetical protein
MNDNMIDTGWKSLIDVDFPEIVLTEEKLAEQGFFGREELERRRDEVERQEMKFYQGYSLLITREN